MLNVSCMLGLVMLFQDPQAADATDELMAADRAFCEETIQRGVDGWLAWFADDAVIFPAQGTPIRGSNALSTYYRERSFPPPGFRWQPERAAITAARDLGWTLGSWTMGEPVTQRGTYLTIWRRQDGGGWKVAADCGGDAHVRTRLPHGVTPQTQLTWNSVFEGRSQADELRWQAGTLDGVSSTGRFLTVWRRDEDRWKVEIEIGGLETTPPRVEPWPEANARFEHHPRWLGADDAYSVRLGEERILWLFADTFLGKGDVRTRGGSRMIRNSLAIQRGRNPVTARFTFHWATRDGEPHSFFDRPGDTWFWPGDGERVGDALVVFLMEVRSSTEGLGFAVVGARAVRIANPDDEPDAWDVAWLDVPTNDRRIIVGAASVFEYEQFVYACSPQEGGAHDAYLVRWPRAAFTRGDLSNMTWWGGPQGFVPATQGNDPVPIFTGAQTEFTMHHDVDRRRFVVVQTQGFGGTTIGVREAPRPEGPWSACTTIYRPPESDREGTLVYAAKAHPELEGDGLVLTYVANHTNFATVVNDPSLYFPRFLRVRDK
ncbi:MAG: DUF4185 domain-containing protein [Planctomycetes bacterium]|nr:DUF4185 domain-containing protein [Planctomycetota bacterium]